MQTTELRLTAINLDELKRYIHVLIRTSQKNLVNLLVSL